MLRHLCLLAFTLTILGCAPYRDSETHTNHSRTGRMETHRDTSSDRGREGTDWQPSQPAPLPAAAIEPRRSNNTAAATLLQQASTARQRGDLGKAQSLAERAQTIEPHSGYSYLELARIYQATGDLARARQMALRGLGYSDDDIGLRAALQSISNSAAP